MDLILHLTDSLKGIFTGQMKKDGHIQSEEIKKMGFF